MSMANMGPIGEDLTVAGAKVSEANILLLNEGQLDKGDEQRLIHRFLVCLGMTRDTTERACLGSRDEHSTERTLESIGRQDTYQHGTFPAS